MNQNMLPSCAKVTFVKVDHESKVVKKVDRTNRKSLNPKSRFHIFVTSIVVFKMNRFNQTRALGAGFSWFRHDRALRRN